MSECDLTDAERFMALMILHKNFRTIILTAVKKGNKKQVEAELKKCKITLTNDQIDNIMSWDDNILLEGYRDITDLSIKVYDPSSGYW